MGRWCELSIGITLVGLVCLIYAQVTGHAFLAYDDDLYITANPNLGNGLTFAGIRWAFASIYESNWIPLTWISHLVDVQLFGLNPAGHHLTNVAIHAVNSLLLWFLMFRMTACRWRSALVAVLFAVHPLHVESVVWAAERKDLLCAFFFLLTLIGYGYYRRQGRLRPYCVSLLCFVLALFAKPMAVSLPVVLLLLDRWPLAGPGWPNHSPWQRWADKVPFLVGSAVISVITVIAQAAGGSLASLTGHPAGERLANALLALAGYGLKILAPVRLAVFYPYPAAIPVWQPVMAGGVVAVITVLAVHRYPSAPYLVVGWLWFIVTLVPVLGLIQVGDQAMADRYLYLPIIGPLILAVWGGDEFRRRFRLPSALVTALVFAAIAMLSLLSWRQTGVWQDQVTLFRHAVAVTKNNYVAYFQLGNGLADQGRLAEAEQAFATSIAIRPTSRAYHNLAHVQERAGRVAQALAGYRQAITLNPGSVEAHYHLGLLLLRQWQAAEATDQFRAVLRLDPDHAKARLNLERAQRVLRSGPRGQ